MLSYQGRGMPQKNRSRPCVTDQRPVPSFVYCACMQSLKCLIRSIDDGNFSWQDLRSAIPAAMAQVDQYSVILEQHLVQRWFQRGQKMAENKPDETAPEKVWRKRRRGSVTTACGSILAFQGSSKAARVRRPTGGRWNNQKPRQSAIRPGIQRGCGRAT